MPAKNCQLPRLDIPLLRENAWQYAGDGIIPILHDREEIYTSDGSCPPEMVTADQNRQYANNALVISTATFLFCSRALDRKEKCESGFLVALKRIRREKE